MFKPKLLQVISTSYRDNSTQKRLPYVLNTYHLSKATRSRSFLALLLSLLAFSLSTLLYALSADLQARTFSFVYKLILDLFPSIIELKAFLEDNVLFSVCTKIVQSINGNFIFPV